MAATNLVLVPGLVCDVEIWRHQIDHLGDLANIIVPPATGGDYGHPFDRPAETVREDVIDGYVSRAAAKTDYGVVLDDRMDIDWAATKTARQR